MEYKEEFDKLLESTKDDDYIGLGNPNANILIIGKEAGIDESNDRDLSIHRTNRNKWIEKIDVLWQVDVEKDQRLKNKNHTWQKYQTLYNKISGQHALPNYKINFLEHCFTTELNDGYGKTSAQAKKDKSFKDRLDIRKNNFFKSDFIRSFPVVLIAALDTDYITNKGEGENREIDNIFQVKYIREKETPEFKQKYWIHHSVIDDKPKLVIHTRQFVNGASNELIEAIAEEIKNFLSQFNYIEEKLPSEDQIKITTREAYLKQYKDKEKAFEKMLQIRNFEIELYWKRAAYFWGFMAAIFTGYASLYSKGENLSEPSNRLSLLLACLGFICSWAFYLVLRGSKFWQVNWEKQLYAIEDEVVGPLTKTTLRKEKYRNGFHKINSPYPSSVSKVNQFLSKIIIAFWMIVLADNLVTSLICEDYTILYTPLIILLCVGTLFAIYRMIQTTTTGIDDLDNEKHHPNYSDRTYSDIDFEVRGLRDKDK